MAEPHSLPHRAQGLPPDLLNHIVDTFKALSDPTRAQLLYLLTAHEYSVNELSDCVAVLASAVSHHLAKLRALRLVRTRRNGTKFTTS
jgi:ArsR family transcriptional regulator, zinc-responsive transcriptional repressor